MNEDRLPSIITIFIPAINLQSICPGLASIVDRTIMKLLNATTGRTIASCLRGGSAPAARSLLVLAFGLFCASCVSSTRVDSRELARSYISQYVNNVRKPPINALYNGHPAGQIKVTYDLECPGSPVVRKSVLVNAYENVTVSPATCRMTIVEMDFTDPFYISR